MPISSMTGFASTASEGAHCAWRWDVKSVNARGLDLRFRLPPGRESLEPALRKVAQARLKRGSVLVSLSVQEQMAAAETFVDASELSAAVAQVATVARQLAEAGLPVAPVHPAAVLSLSGVRRSAPVKDGGDAADDATAMVEGFTAAIDDLLTVRHAEGEQLARVITEQVTQIEVLTRDAETLAAGAVEALRHRLRDQIAALLSDPVREDRLEQEVALLASKADIREELDRLHAHVAAARGLVAGGGAVGRKLDFLTQEFNREVNTLCSKSATEALTRVGLDLKTVIEQLREQAANVE